MRQNKHSVSVIIPTYNRREELLRAINSVQSQSLPPMEIIIIDDGSGFDVKSYLEQNGVLPDEKITFMRNEQNTGPSNARNQAINVAKGALIAFLDSDDYWDREKLEKQLDLFARDQALGFVYCNTWIVENNRKRPRKGKLLREKIFESAVFKGWTAPNTSTIVMKRDLFLRLEGFDNELQSNEDFDLWFKVDRAGVKVDFVAEPLSFFSYDANNRISTHFNRKFEGGLRFLNKWKPVIIKDLGKKAYRTFRNQFMFGLAFPIFLDRIKHRKFMDSAKIYLRHLIFSMHFYQTFGKKLSESYKISGKML